MPGSFHSPGDEILVVPCRRASLVWGFEEWARTFTVGCRPAIVRCMMVEFAHRFTGIRVLVPFWRQRGLLNGFAPCKLIVFVFLLRRLPWYISSGIVSCLRLCAVRSCLVWCSGLTRQPRSIGRVVMGNFNPPTLGFNDMGTTHLTKCSSAR